jgi:hypothetical protein
MSLLAAVVESSPANYYFQLSDTSGGTDIFESPFEVQSLPDRFGALNITVTDAQSAIITAQPNNGAGINAAAVLQLGCPSSQQAVTIQNDGTRDQIEVGRPATSGVIISSAPANGGTGSIIVNSSVGTEKLELGANPVSFKNITLSATGSATTLFSKPPGLDAGYAVVPELANGTGTVGNTAASLITNPATPGLYVLMVSCSTASSISAQLSAVCYFNGTKWSAGGVTEVVANFVGTVLIAPAATTAANLILTNNSGASLTNISYIFVPIFAGVITGMP